MIVSLPEFHGDMHQNVALNNKLPFLSSSSNSMSDDATIEIWKCPLARSLACLFASMAGSILHPLNLGRNEIMGI